MPCKQLEEWAVKDVEGLEEPVLTSPRKCLFCCKLLHCSNKTLFRKYAAEMKNKQLQLEVKL